MRLSPLVYADPVGGAFFPVTSTLLAEVYLAPKPTAWDMHAALDDRAAPWVDSLSHDPDGVASAIDRALTELIHAAASYGPDTIDPKALDEGRARSHLSALLSVWDRRATVPADLHAMRHVLTCGREDALAPLTLLAANPDPFATATEAAVEAQLRAHHGVAPDAATGRWLERQPKPAGTGTLAHLQRGFSNIAAAASDPTVHFHELRDSLHVARYAAALARQMLEDGRAHRESDIAVLTPNDSLSQSHLAEAFAAQGLRLTGLQNDNGRDLVAEVATLAVRVLQHPAPTMALASLATLPLMPWSQDEGAAIARDLMRGHYQSRAAERLSGPAADLWQTLASGAQSGAQAAFKLAKLAEAVVSPEGDPDLLARARGHLRRLAAVAHSGADQAALERMARQTPAVEPTVTRHFDGVSLFAESELPWRGCRHLIVTGFAAGHYPMAAGTSPFFLDSERVLIQRTLGLRLPTTSDALARGLALFQQQLAAASETATFLTPRLDGYGKPLAAPLTRALMARAMGVTEERLLEAPDAVPVTEIAPLPNPRPLPVEAVDLGQNLLNLRRDDQGGVLPQSPSRLEQLMVSPLAWLLAEADAVDVPWKPDTLDIKIRGTLAHYVLERMFPERMPLPEAATLAAAVDVHLKDAIRKKAPFLAGPQWQLECEALKRDTLRAAQIWREILETEGAEILANETRLSGTVGGLGPEIVVSGRADCLIRLGNGQIVIVDHKSSGATARRKRMTEGWDLQLSLYRMMLQRPADAASPKTRDIQSGLVGVAYHTLRDGTVLRSGVHGLNRTSPRVDEMSADISVKALALLTERIAQVAKGTVRMNGTEDEAFLDKKASLTPYAFNNSPLIRALMVEGNTIAAKANEADAEEQP